MEKNNRSKLWVVLAYGSIFVVGLALFYVTSNIVCEIRGYFAIGGEMFFVFLPLLYWIIKNPNL